MLAEKNVISVYAGWVSLIYSCSRQHAAETPKQEDYIHLSTNGSCWHYFRTVLHKCKFTQHNTQVLI